MDNLTPQQIRRLFHLLSKLAFGQKQGSHIQVQNHAFGGSRYWTAQPWTLFLLFFIFYCPSSTDLCSSVLFQTGWYAHSDPQTALQHCAQVQAHWHHWCCDDCRQHGGFQVKTCLANIRLLCDLIFRCHQQTLSLTSFVCSRSKAKESQSRSLSQETIRQVRISH